VAPAAADDLLKGIFQQKKKKKKILHPPSRGVISCTDD
jgi:hypothetical protein